MAHEPGRIAFPAQAGAPAARRASDEPRALTFPASSAPKRDTLSRVEPADGPRAVAFKPAPVQAAAPAPAAVSFEGVRARPTVRAAGVSAFEEAGHPLRESALRKAQELSPDLVKGNEARLARYLSELLPLKSAAVENFGAHSLDQCRVHAENAAHGAQFHARLNATEILQAALESNFPRTGLKARLKSFVADSPETHRARLQGLRPQLTTLLSDIRRALPEVLADGQRLALSLLALRSVREVTGTCPDTVLELAVVRRLETLRVALAQAELVPAQMRGQEGTLSLQTTECDRLLNVTFSAVALASQVGAATGQR